ncbi:pre-toxin TG domain-containing protein [Paenibacillus sp. PsM32]|uniref:pre-toxin TG domain-containing protein n=1 Tax=Paenibacillus sp. PsM32 TaxID=3030536 RepID=UPI00263B7E00|nr:pre-toxin TG domain-containing protein [Paenibacillus sp. PsM32]MDN4620978.1 pre-toxin TG domain-containing protein [Paenibacillus sp. PsM32]
MKTRYYNRYNPEIKRFVNRDVLNGSIDDGLTMNRYAYVNGNPISYIDPFGLSADGDSWVTTGLSYGADAIPYVGTVKGIQETITGFNYITGEQLSVADRVANGIGSLTSLIPIPGAKYVGKYGTEGVIDAGGWVLKQFGKNETKQVASRYRLRVNLQLFAEGTVNGNITSKELNAFGNRTEPRGARPSNDFGVSESTDVVGPQAPPLPNGASTVTDVNRIPLSGHYHTLPEGTELPDGLGVIHDGSDVLPNSPRGHGHNTIYPTRPMTVEEFNQLFKSLPWRYGGKK